jgi:hypothetical protein
MCPIKPFLIKGRQSGSAGFAFPCEKGHYSCKQNECFENWFFETLKLKFEPF